MQAFIDVIGSFILGGLILVMSTKLNFAISDNSQQANIGLATQENCVLVSKMLESDFSKIGYNSKTGTPVLASDSTKIKFFGDIDNNGTVDSITYYTGPMPVSIKSPNPRHKMMYRTWNTKTTSMNVGITKFNVSYFDSSGAKTTLPWKVKALKVEMELESIIPTIDTLYTVVHWEQYIKPKVFQYNFN